MTPDRQAILEARDEVFARSEFELAEESTTGGLLDAFTTFRDSVVAFREQQPIAFLVVMIALLLTVIVLVIHMVWTVRIARRAAFDDLETDLSGGGLDRTPPEAFRSRALDHAAAGRLDEAVRDLWAALLVALDRRGFVRWARHKALLDYRLEARDPLARKALERFARSYHPTSFGRRPLPQARFDDLLATLDEVLA